MMAIVHFRGVFLVCIIFENIEYMLSDGANRHFDHVSVATRVTYQVGVDS